jgi:UPF0716 protein FxsA
MPLLLLLFIILPIIEIYVLIEVGSQIGAPLTIGIIFTTAVIGYRLFRAQGLEKLQKMRSTMNGANHGETIAMDIAEGAAILLAGALLLTPGFVTDAFGFACLIPPIRKVMIKTLFSKFIVKVGNTVNNSAHYQAGTHNQQNPQANNVIEGEVIKDDYRENK